VLLLTPTNPSLPNATDLSPETFNDPMSAVHPTQALFAGEKPFPAIPACEHFAGSEKLILKALELQDKLGPIFDITCDCEDGAPAGREKEHAEMIVRLVNSAANKHAHGRRPSA
jgi:citrate lyase subunit beta/citryl-CoA lyase